VNPDLLEKIKAETEDAIRGIETLITASTPGSIQEAIESGWMEKGMEVGQVALGGLPLGWSPTWRKRVVNVTTANRILREFEDDLVRAFVIGNRSVATKTFGAAFFQVQWALSHTGRILSLLSSILWHFRYDFLSAAWDFGILVRHFLYGSWIQGIQEGLEAGEKWLAIVAAFTAAAMGALAAFVITPAIVACSAAGVAVAVSPLAVMSARCAGKVKDKALPQAGKRYRRKKRSRRN